MTGSNTHGGFQNYTSVQAAKASKIPSGTSFASASVIPLALDTAAVGLYTSTEKGGLGLEYPSLDPKDSGKVVFIWGGSSSVGAIATQLSVASGAKVVTTASEHNFGFCKANGASEVWFTDMHSSLHKSPSTTLISIDQDPTSARRCIANELVLGHRLQIHKRSRRYHQSHQIPRRLLRRHLRLHLPPRPILHPNSQDHSSTRRRLSGSHFTASKGLTGERQDSPNLRNWRNDASNLARLGTEGAGDGTAEVCS